MKLNKTVITALQKIVGANNVLLDEAQRLSYGSDNSLRCVLPDIVVLTLNHGTTGEVVKLCYENNIPIVARGAGTGTPGGAVPIHGGLILSFEKMNKIIELDIANRVMTVEPGVTNEEIQIAAAKHRLFWAPDPGSAATCTVGGNLAYNSAGPRAIKYGTCRENTLGLKAITGDGREIRTGCYTTKGVVGYDLTRLLIGSEGTLAIITEAHLKLLPLNKVKLTTTLFFNSVENATQAIVDLMTQPNTPCALEFLDSPSLDLIRGQDGISIPEEAQALLIIEFDSDGSEHIDLFKTNSFRQRGILNCHLAKTNEEANTLWKLRKSLSPALRQVAPKKINEDVVVPISEIPRFLSQLQAYASKYQIKIITFGHAGNGNLHVNLLIDPDNPREEKAASDCLAKIFETVIKLKGTLSGEHGVGLDKKDFIHLELDPVSIELMKKIKQQFDPRGILNPGKMFD